TLSRRLQPNRGASLPCLQPACPQGCPVLLCTTWCVGFGGSACKSDGRQWRRLGPCGRRLLATGGVPTPTWRNFVQLFARPVFMRLCGVCNVVVHSVFQRFCEQPARASSGVCTWLIFA